MLVRIKNFQYDLYTNYLPVSAEYRTQQHPRVTFHQISWLLKRGTQKEILAFFAIVTLVFSSATLFTVIHDVTMNQNDSL